MIELERYKGNPILEPKSENCEAIFNPGACCCNGEVILLSRIVDEYEKYVSRIGLHRSTDGFNFESAGSIFGPDKQYDRHGCEDPRITEIDGKFYLTYVGLSKPARQGGGPPAIALASTEDFRNFQRHGLITKRQDDTRDGVLFPKKINGEFVILTRPFRLSKNEMDENTLRKMRVETPCPYNDLPEKPSIWISYSHNLKDWFGHKVIMESKEWWESEKIGAGAPPVKTPKGWLIIYHSVDAAGVYYIGAALLDYKNPSNVIGRTKEPILKPREWYERTGDKNDVVFPEGNIVKDGTLFVYYGGADKYIGVATCNLKKLLDSLTN
jgi:predicted GH43/DUF377 family glycosyl hydrolase